MKRPLHLLAVILLCFASSLVAGCGGDAPATPATPDREPTGAEPPPGEKEAVLPEGGP